MTQTRPAMRAASDEFTAEPDGERPVNATPGTFTLDELLTALDLRGDVPPVRGRTLLSAHGGVLGSQQVGQQVVLAERLTPGKSVHSVSTIFTRPGDSRRPVWIDVERLAHGSSIDTLALSFRQDSQLLSRANLMLRAPEAHLVDRRTSIRMPPGPEAGEPRDNTWMMPWEIRQLPRAEGAQQDRWARITGAGDDPSIWRALLAHSCELYPVPDIAIAEGLMDQDGAATTAFASAALSLTVTFLDDLDVRDWHLFRVHALHASHGRTTSRVEIFTADGELRAQAETIGLLRAARKASRA
ncbi:acyl-CoA thioesterase domain-containing protein [Frankia sp. AgB32]|uniref:acyl-CoA thioesterase n=1 Tax=Frankia sp. AgB32 TaxID=631119 RepID=UPI00200FFD13|nr:acyl-CoA thioesterase domain-containing protein [Frankia sp. AgB32]MCK9893143.1 thioesterase family protein [Frankia sp. AgB32]